MSDELERAEEGLEALPVESDSPFATGEPMADPYLAVQRLQIELEQQRFLATLRLQALAAITGGGTFEQRLEKAKTLASWLLDE